MIFVLPFFPWRSREFRSLGVNQRFVLADTRRESDIGHVAYVLTSFKHSSRSDRVVKLGRLHD